MFLAFLTPKIDPSIEEEDEEDDEEGPRLPTRSNQEFRPFIRRLPEFKFWYVQTKDFKYVTKTHLFIGMLQLKLLLQP